MMMLLGGFGFLMTFLKKYGLSALGFTMIITVVVAQFSLIVFGLLKMDPAVEFVIKIGFVDLVEASLIAAAVLISFGVIIGKVNPLQLLFMAIIESIFCIINLYIGYTLLGVVDVGGSIFIHTFGAYFGLAVSFCLRNIKTEESWEREGNRYTSDLFSILGTIILWVYWPSFNGLLAVGAARQRAVINTYLSLMASTATTYVVSGLLGHKKFAPEDIQNATLAGGVMVGATADMVLQPYGAVTAGTIAGAVSCFGYKYLNGKVFQKLKIHDTCGVNNLHGLPGIMAGLLSIMVTVLASESTWGDDMYRVSILM